jgi:eukaryotic-like serine/threonine-protein kinase
MELAEGELVDGKYRVVRLIGVGGMGTVYEGVNVRIDRRVAIKVLHSNVASVPEFAERFEREARAAARIRSPYICDVLDLGEFPGGERFIVMEYLEGVPLEDRMMTRQWLTPTQLAPIAFELLDGLATMHATRVIHRDLKPANVFLARTPVGRGEIVKILDFGVAKLLPFDGESMAMTKVGLVGTPLYMSPEQARGQRDIDARSDLYAASVIFYQALTGELPHEAAALNELLVKIALEPPRPLLEIRPDLDEEFASIVHRGMEHTPEKRFPNARTYQAAIAAWGRKQGRESLQFILQAHTDEVDEPPPSTAPPKPRPSLFTEATRSSLPDLASSAPHAWSDTPTEHCPPSSQPAVKSLAPPSAPPRRTSSVPARPPPSDAISPSVSLSVTPAEGIRRSLGGRRALTFTLVGGGALAVALIVVATRGMGGTSPSPAQSSADAPIDPSALGRQQAASVAPTTAPPPPSTSAAGPPAIVTATASGNPAPHPAAPATPSKPTAAAASPMPPGSGAQATRRAPPGGSASAPPHPPAHPPTPTDSSRSYRRSLD